MKKLIALLLAAVMVLSMFAACSKTPVETNPAETTPAVTPTKEATPENVAPNAEPVYIAENAQELAGEITFYTAFAGESCTWNGIIGTTKPLLYCGVIAIGFACTVQVAAQVNIPQKLHHSLKIS